MSSNLASFRVPPSSVPPANFSQRLSYPSRLSHYRTPLSPLLFLLRAALIKPNKTALIHPERGFQFTYLEWSARILSLTFALKSTNAFKTRDRIAVISPNSSLILECHNAVLGAGGVVVPINIRNTPQEVSYVLQHSGSTIILVDHQFKHLLQDQHFKDPNLTIIVSNDSGGNDQNDQYEHFLNRGREIWDQEESKDAKGRRGWELIMGTEDEEAPCALCYTSGTTGRPKGVLTSYRGSYLAAISNAFEAQLNSDSVYLWILPAFHAVGWTFPWSVNAAFGTHLIIRRVDNDLIWDCLKNRGVTHYSGAPTVQIGIVNHPKAARLPNKVRVAVAASAPTAALLAKMESLNLEPVHVYGLTETYGPITRRYSEPHWSELSVEERARLAARQGHGFLTSDEVRVVKIDEDGNSVFNGDLVEVKKDGKETGEIVTRGNLVMLEYYKDKAATEKVIRNGWFHTGDIGVQYPGNEIAILDRSKDIIISGGENISSLMVEQELSSHPQVLECCVVARPHKKWGERGHATVVLKIDSPKKSNQEWEAELKAHCKSKMSGFAVPEWIEIVEELPKTSTGKVQKNVLRQRMSKL